MKHVILGFLMLTLLTSCSQFLLSVFAAEAEAVEKIVEEQPGVPVTPVK